MSSAKKYIGCLASAAIAGIGVFSMTPVASAAIPHPSGVVINEVYGGGGNTGAAYTHDFVELYNSSAVAVPLTGWSLQYRAAGNAGTAAITNVNALSGTIEPGEHFLVQLAAGSGNGAPLPTANQIVTTAPLNMSGTAGVVILADTTSGLLCATGATACASHANTVDLVGYGGANTFAGTPAPGTTNPTSATRDAQHSNSGLNGADFTVGPPSPTPGPVPPPPDPTAYTIAEIQGTAPSSTHVGELVVTEGVVTAAYPTGGFNGFVIQTEGTGGLADLAGHTASDGIAVFGAVPATLELGDLVSVTGTVQENFGLTRIAIPNADAVAELATPFDPVSPVTAAWPATAAERETIESMLYTPPTTLTVSETFPTNQYGEVGLATGTTPLMQPSDVAPPGTPEFAAVVTDNFARGVTLDDGASTNYLTAATSSSVPPFIDAGGSLRVGGNASVLTSVIVDFQFGAWRFQPLGPVTAANDESFVTFASTRPAAPDPAALGDGEIKVATFNVLNYFTTGGEAYEAAHPGVDCTSFNDRAGNPVTVNRCRIPGNPPIDVNGPRGAWNDENLARQQAKTVAAINAMDAHVVGLMEMENSANMGETVDEATATLVAALNADAGAPVWAFVPSPVELPAQELRDVITNAIIYKPAVVSPVGESRALGTESDAGGAFDNAREPIGQAFVHVAGGDPFFVAVNHFKSKGCDDTLPPTDPNSDQGDGQSCFNADRVEQAEALSAWVDALLPSYSPPITDAFLIGDFNAYTQEDPMQVFYGAGYADLNAEHGNPKQSYNFDGLNGSLDHILANESALPRVTGSDIWNINAPESLALEYSRYNYHGALFYTPDQYRSSDHDPEIAAIRAGLPAPIIAVPTAGAVTADTTPTIAGTAAPGTTVEVAEGATVVGTAVTASDGSWTLTSATLAEGAHTIVATARDDRGQISAASAPVTFTVDSVAPARPRITSPSQLALVRTANVGVAGTAEAGATVTVHVDRAVAATAPVDASGAWSLSTPPLPNGLHLLTARAVDAAGNRSSVSHPVLIVVCDLQAPGGRFSLGWLLFCRGR